MRTTLIIILVSTFTTIFAQDKSQVVWEVNAVRLNDHEAAIAFTATIPDSVCIYSCVFQKDSVSPTQFKFIPSDEYQLVGSVTEGGNVIVTNDPVFGTPLKRYERSASFTQRVRLKAAFTLIKGNISFMASSVRNAGSTRMVNFSVAVKVRDL